MVGNRHIAAPQRNVLFPYFAPLHGSTLRDATPLAAARRFTPRRAA